MASRSLLVLTFVVDRSTFGVRLEAADRVLAMVAVEPLPSAPGAVLGVINLHGRVIPVFDLRRRVGWPVCEYGADAHLVVARTARRTVALAVDEVVGVREVAAAAVAPPDQVGRLAAHLAGIVALTDGVLYIENLEVFLAAEEEQRLNEALGEAGRP